jgi:ferrous iron transport protein A
MAYLDRIWSNSLDSIIRKSNRDGLSSARRRGHAVTLDHVELRRDARVAEIAGGLAVRSHLNTLGIHVGDVITVVERAPFRGPILIEVKGSRVAIGRGVAQKVRVEQDPAAGTSG